MPQPGLLLLDCTDWPISRRSERLSRVKSGRILDVKRLLVKFIPNILIWLVETWCRLPLTKSFATMANLRPRAPEKGRCEDNNLALARLSNKLVARLCEHGSSLDGSDIVAANEKAGSKAAAQKPSMAPLAQTTARREAYMFEMGACWEREDRQVHDSLIKHWLYNGRYWTVENLYRAGHRTIACYLS